MFLYNKNSVYRNRIFLYKYNNNSYKLVNLKSCRDKGFEEIKSNLLTSFKNNDINKTSAEEIKRISLSRTKRNIFEIALCNSFEYFVTLTVKLNNIRYDLELAQSELKKLLKAYKRKYKNFKFIIITEKHQDGAYHFHRSYERFRRFI